MIATPLTSRLVWPMPALLAWTASWAAFAGLRALLVPFALGFMLAAVLGAALAQLAPTPWRRVFVGGGFPLSYGAIGIAGALPAWAWLVPLALLLVAYPLRAWRDAPLFPTLTGALRGLAAILPPNVGEAAAKILDAGCGLGAGLAELRREYPHAQLFGIEWSLPLRLAAAWRCRYARIVRGDIWAESWRDYDLVYLFQRPESLPRAIRKARTEMRPGTWLASLEFEALGVHAEHVLADPGRRPVWLYRVPFA